MGGGIGVPAQREMVVRGVVESFVEVSFSQKSRLCRVQARAGYLVRDRASMNQQESVSNLGKMINQVWGPRKMSFGGEFPSSLTDTTAFRTMSDARIRGGFI